MIPLVQHLQLARAVAGHTKQIVRAAPNWLLAHHVQPWMGERSLPLWLADPDWAGFNAGGEVRRVLVAGRLCALRGKSVIIGDQTRGPNSLAHHRILGAPLSLCERRQSCHGNR